MFLVFPGSSSRTSNLRTGVVASLLGLALLLSGCVNTPRFNTVKSVSEPLQLTRLYVYVFLDIREELIGRQTLQALERQLAARFEANGVASAQLWFKQSPVGREVALGEQPGRGSLYGSSSTVRVPVATVIRGNAQAEVDFAPRYRLTAFPAQTSGLGSGVGYTIYWDLVDTQSNRLVWRTDSSVSNTNWWKNDEWPEERAKAMVDGLFAEFARSGINCRASCF